MTKIKKGDKVKLTNCAEANDYSNIIFECVTDSWKLGNGREVIRITSPEKDFRGGFAVNRLIKMVDME
jgi:hypothetical protein